MSKHEHKECDHKLRYCEKCDVVYCLKCSKEWGGHKHNYVSPFRSREWITTDYPIQTRWENTSVGNTSGDLAHYECDHSTSVKYECSQGEGK